jgi:uncharacterized NAD-dependent epimerase/dehydratase family protein
MQKRIITQSQFLENSSGFNIRGSAFLLSNGILHERDAKTSHGLIRSSDRFIVKAVIDSYSAGKDAGEVLDGVKRNIPVYASLDEAIIKVGKPDYCIIGIATVGGALPDDLKKLIMIAMTKGLSIVNGLHYLLNEQPEMVEFAVKYGVKMVDVRKPKPFKDLKFWSEEVFEVKCPIIAVMGTDCAIGKRTAAMLLKQGCEKAGLKAEMIYTGQTGWMQGAKYGFILDSTLNGFVSGELSNAIISACKIENPDLIFLEGQSSLRNPSGPCGAEFLISGNAKKVILVHQPLRKYFGSEPKWREIPSVENEINLINSYGSEVIALMLNTSGLNSEEANYFKESYLNKLGIPVILPLEEGVDTFVQSFKNLKK